MSNRQFQNFCEYQLRGSQNRCFALPNFSYGKTTLNNNILCVIFAYAKTQTHEAHKSHSNRRRRKINKMEVYTKMATRKAIWDALDVIEGKKKGSSYSNLQKEMVRQGYKKKKKK